MVAVLLFGTALWMAALLLWLRSGTASAYHPLGWYLLFHGLVFVARPWLNWWYGYRFIYLTFQFLPTAAERRAALFAADLGLAAFALACLAGGRGVALRIKPAPGRRTELHRRYRGSLWVAVVARAPVAVASLLADIRRAAAGATDMVMDAATGVQVHAAGNGYLAEAHVMLVPLTVLVAWAYRFRLAALLPFLLYLFARSLVGGARWTFLLGGASLALCFLYERRARWPGRALVMPALACGLLFTALGQDRGQVLGWLGVRAEAPPPAPAGLRPLEDENYANQEFLEYVVRAVPALTGRYGLFLDNLQLLTEPVPRALWPGKPIGAPIRRFELFDYGRPIGMTLSLPGEGWAQAGLLGVGLWCGLAGWACGWAHRWFARCVQTEFQVAAYLLLLPLSVQLFRDGTLVSAARFPLFYLLPLAAWWLVARANGRRIVERRALPPRPGVPA